MEEVFHILDSEAENGDKFITLCADLDLTYKITHSLDYEAARFGMIQLLEEKMGEKFYYWKFEDEDGNCVFIIKTRENSSVKRTEADLRTYQEQRETAGSCRYIETLQRNTWNQKKLYRSQKTF